MKQILIFISVLALTGCVSKARKQQIISFEAALEAQTGQSYSVVSYNARQDGFSVLKNETTGSYEAYYTAKWDTLTMTSYADFAAIATEGDIYLNLVKTEYTQSSGDGDYTYYTYNYGSLRFENNGSATKDLELIASMREDAAKAYLSHRLKSEFSLSSSRAEELATMTTRYQRLENRRALTDSEKDQFAVSALGVSMTSVERAIKKKAQGNEAEYEDILETAARVNKTTPEQVGRFFDEMAGNF